MTTKIQIGVTIDKNVMKRFRVALDKHSLKISPVLEALVEYFLDTLEKEIDNERTEERPISKGPRGDVPQPSGPSGQQGE